jgi:hypothetical protein
MKVQASGILILIACILTGCGKSMQDVAGVYETAEIKEPLNSVSYYSTTWVLDLAESGTYTLEEAKFRNHIQGQTFDPLPLVGFSTGGAWRLQDGVVIVTQEWLRNDGVIEMVTVDLPFNLEASGDLVSDLPFMAPGNSVNISPAEWDMLEEFTLEQKQAIAIAEAQARRAMAEGPGGGIRFKRVE